MAPEPVWVFCRRVSGIELRSLGCPIYSQATKPSGCSHEVTQIRIKINLVQKASVHSTYAKFNLNSMQAALTAQGLASRPDARIQTHPLLLSEQGVTWTAGIVGRIAGPRHWRCCTAGSVPWATGKSTLAAGGCNRNMLLSRL